MLGQHFLTALTGLQLIALHGPSALLVAGGALALGAGAGVSTIGAASRRAHSSNTDGGGRAKRPAARSLNVTFTRVLTPPLLC